MSAETERVCEMAIAAVANVPGAMPVMPLPAVLALAAHARKQSKQIEALEAWGRARAAVAEMPPAEAYAAMQRAEAGLLDALRGLAEPSLNGTGQGPTPYSTEPAGSAEPEGGA